MPWIEDHVNAFIPLIEPLGVADEGTLHQLCEQEITNWRARDLAQASLNSPMTAMRAAIKRIPLTERNTWVDPRTNEVKHIALKYMNFSKEEWDLIKSSTKKTVLHRMQNQQLIERPDDYVRLILHFLESENWAELACAWIAAIGCRLTEGLYTADISVCTDYTVMFSGQLKTSLPDTSYEKPALVSASLLVERLARLRQHKELADCSLLSLNQISHKYGPKVREAARAAFGEVLPVRAGKTQIATQDLRAVYACVAVHWYCPSQINDRLYASSILGHLQGAASEAEALDRLSTEEHYSDYYMNGPLGQKLGEPGVVILKAFQPPSEPVADPPQIQNGGIQDGGTKKTKRSARPTLHVAKVSHDRVSKLKSDWKLSSLNDVIERLLDQNEALEQSLGQLSPERLGLPDEVVEKIRQAMKQSQKQDFQGFLEKALTKEANIRIGTAQRYKEVDLVMLPTSELEKQQKSPQVTEERIRRAVITLMLYNQQQADPKLRASLTQNAVHALVKGRFENIGDFLEKHQHVIARHHADLQVPEKRSAKVKLSELVIAEDAKVFETLFLPVQESQAEAIEGSELESVVVTEGLEVLAQAPASESTQDLELSDVTQDSEG